MDFDMLQARLGEIARATSSNFQKLPGSAMIVRYIQSSYQNDPVRSAIELVLVLFFIRYLMSPSYSTHKQNFVKLQEGEIEELIDEWTPEPIVADRTAVEEIENERLPVIVGPTGPKVKLSNGRTAFNLASYNFYNFNSNEQIKEKAIQTLRTYGVGPCGPPQFYGTQDVHEKAESDIASYLGTEGCILYAQTFSTATSVIPTFCKRRDVIIADAAVNYSIRKGLEISRSNVRWFKHGDFNDLERVLKAVANEQAKSGKLTRRFVVTEGFFEITGDVTDLPRLVELKEKYKIRIILDETWSFGVLGRTGRGLTEAQNVDPQQVDMIIGSLAGPLCAGGGFCAGSKDVIEHQRITSSAYTFSAALPAMLAMTTSESLKLLQSNPDILVQCRESIRALRAQLDPRSDWVVCTSSVDNPILLLVIKPEVVNARRLTADDQEKILMECVEESLANGVMITRLKTRPYANAIAANDWTLQPALKICVTSALSKKDIEKAGFGVKVGRQNYTYHSAGQIYTGENVYGILQAPRGDATEAIVLVAAWKSIDEQLNRNGIALVLTLARYFKRWSLWSKDIILLLPPDSTTGTQAWVDAYHDAHDFKHIAPLPLKSGALQGAIAIDYPHEQRYHELHIIYDGTNGQLPNLDLINSIVNIAGGQMGIETTVQQMTGHTDSYQDRLQTMLRGMLYQGLGYPTGPHSSFIPYHVDAITLQPTGEGWHDEMAMGRVVEGSFRSLNNLLEHLHQSFFFYLLMQKNRFVSIGTYLPSAMLLAANFTIMAIFLWVKSGQPTVKDVGTGKQQSDGLERKGDTAPSSWSPLTVERNLLSPLTFVAICHSISAIPLFLFNHLGINRNHTRYDFTPSPREPIC
ncbi:Gaa1-like protein [Trichoderma asperelloides]|nr:Gaa1-like protein [Trichoderma asperelloides]